ncbi:LOW QUALITY PROTEIN: hypothetical protein Cgig2_026676 [Carnegiea gigantea]|uniref:Uncharacterized protein n=1 Tax=Carnegiea gigantea TaxID=171969 RepID=A0A9Q1JZ08_9CARY|nr:LOW QUALITY PROTEIN: hypothetical protein Cgig2_026676 [Carnegiea gigantea]
MPSFRPMERSREVARSDRSDRLPTGQQGGRAAVEPSRHTTIECRELKKGLHELADKWQIDRFMKRGPRFLRQEQAPAPPPPRDEECSTEVVAAIAGGYEVNLMGMIRLSVCFGDKNKFKNLEVDFLVVDVPTTYNVIVGWPTLHRVKAVPLPKQKMKTNINKKGDGDYTSGLPPSSCPSSSDAPASASRGLVASSSAASPSDKGGIDSTSSGSRPFAATRSRSSTKHRPQNTGRSQIHLQGLARLCGGIQGCRSGLAGSPPPWLRPHQPRPSPADAAALSSRSRGPLGPPVASYSVSGIGRRAPLAAGTPR